MPKDALKHLVAQAAPNELGYRRKSGFVEPSAEQFSTPIFLEHLKAVSELNAPLFRFVEHKLLDRMIVCLESKRTLLTQTYNFLWAFAFFNIWISQLQALPNGFKDNLQGLCAP